MPDDVKEAAQLRSSFQFEPALLKLKFCYQGLVWRGLGTRGGEARANENQAEKCIADQARHLCLLAFVERHHPPEESVVQVNCAFRVMPFEANFQLRLLRTHEVSTTTP